MPTPCHVSHETPLEKTGVKMPIFENPMSAEDEKQTALSRDDTTQTALVAHLERELRLMESDYQSTLQAEPVRTAINGSSRLVALPPLCLISESNPTPEPHAVLVPTRSRITCCVAVHDCASLV